MIGDKLYSLTRLYGMLTSRQIKIDYYFQFVLGWHL
jgi:hypothetical protein